jgi:hypothetical protein
MLPHRPVLHYGGLEGRFLLFVTSTTDPKREGSFRKGTAALSFLISPALISRAFSAATRFSSSDARSSFGFCGTSFPRTAKSRMRRRRRGMASGASPMR